MPTDYKIIDYKIVSGCLYRDSCSGCSLYKTSKKKCESGFKMSLEESVKICINDGWEPIGGVTTQKIPIGKGYQAMIKKIEDTTTKNHR